MSTVKASLCRPLSNELGSLAPAVIAVTLCIAALPWIGGARQPAVAPAVESMAICQFVRLSDAAGEKALRRLRANLSVDPRSVRALRCDLSLSTVAETGREIPVDSSSRAPVMLAPPAAWSDPPWPPSVAAAPAEPLPEASAPAAAEPAFSREEMLEMKRFERKNPQ